MNKTKGQKNNAAVFERIEWRLERRRRAYRTLRKQRLALEEAL